MSDAQKPLMKQNKNVSGDEVQDQLKQRIQQLEIQKLSDAKHVSERLAEFMKHNPNLRDEDQVFVKLLASQLSSKIDEVTASNAKNQNLTRKKEQLTKLCRTLQDENKKHKKWKDEAQHDLNKSIEEVKAKISLYEEENVTIVQNNNQLKDALRKALEYNEQRTKHHNKVQETNDYLRGKYDEMDKKYTAICNEYQNKLEEANEETQLVKGKLVQQVAANEELKKVVVALKQRMNSDKETQQMMKDFDLKCKTLLDENSKYITQLKDVNSQLQKANKALKVKADQARTKGEKFKAENRDMKKTNHKLSKKVNTLTNLCRELQNKNKQLAASRSGETTV